MKALMNHSHHTFFFFFKYNVLSWGTLEIFLSKKNVAIFKEAATEGVLYEKLFLEILVFLKRRLWHSCFSGIVNFAKFLRAPFLQNTSERLPLYLQFVIFKSLSWLFQGSNRIWHKGPVCKSSSVASNQVIQQTR